MNKVNILGQDYEIVFTNIIDDSELNDCYGYCDVLSKRIVINNFDKEHIPLTIKHEIVHAFMYESGLDTQKHWSTDESLIDWIALQIDKMTNTINKAKEIVSRSNDI